MSTARTLTVRRVGDLAGPSRLDGEIGGGTTVALQRLVRHETTGRLLHGARVAGSATILVGAVTVDQPVLAAAATAALFLAAFAANHDVLHGALGLPRWLREPALSILGGSMLLSGHAVRLMHLRHHARPLGPDDLEGATATMSLLRALASAPRLTIAMRLRAYVLATERDKRWVLAETALNLATVLALAASGNPALQAALGAALTMQVLMPIWAGRIPHRTPGWLLAGARALSFTRSATVLSLAYHEAHHRAPRVPCHRLHALGREDR